ncbi:hypothetical protein [Sphingomonas phyllosphaerae]|nr:hypothetical protein [Sphingomonas phyllosphaerae]
MLLDIEKPVPCCLTLEPRDAIKRAAQPLSAAMDADDDGERKGCASR